VRSFAERTQPAGCRPPAVIDRRSRPFGETPHQPDILLPSMKDLAAAIV
jgi:hypothetical protein